MIDESDSEPLRRQKGNIYLDGGYCICPVLLSILSLELSIQPKSI